MGIERQEAQSSQPNAQRTAGAAGGMTEGLVDLAQLAYRQPGTEALLSDVLRLLVESLDVGLAYLSRLQGDALHIERDYDRAPMGVRVGDVVSLCDTY